MKRIIIFLLANFITILTSFSQGTSINITGAEPDPSAGLDINFSNKGLLIPRMTDSQRDAIDNPAEIVINEYPKVLGYSVRCLKE